MQMNNWKCFQSGARFCPARPGTAPERCAGVGAPASMLAAMFVSIPAYPYADSLQKAQSIYQGRLW
jgi:hypothetical protein